MKTADRPDLKFLKAIRRSKPCAVHEITEQLIMDDGRVGNIGDWLIQDGDELALIYNRHFEVDYATEKRRKASDKKRIPRVEKGTVEDTIIIKQGRRGRTDIRKSKDTAAYFIDDLDNVDNRDEAPYAYISLHHPLAGRNVTSGAYVEDVIDVLIDHLKESKTKRNSYEVNLVLRSLKDALRIITTFGIDGVEKRKKPPGCCGGSKE